MTGTLFPLSVLWTKHTNSRVIIISSIAARVFGRPAADTPLSSYIFRWSESCPRKMLADACIMIWCVIVSTGWNKGATNNKPTGSVHLFLQNVAAPKAEKAVLKKKINCRQQKKSLTAHTSVRSCIYLWHLARFHRQHLSEWRRLRGVPYFALNASRFLSWHHKKQTR